MIIYSDNVSYWLLQKYLSEKYPNRFVENETMKDMGLMSPRSPVEETITVREYSSLFRQLYNASYLSPKMSEEALKLLTRTKFTSGLVAGVPSGVKIAHKFGELGLPNGQRQLHDCGIIYYPGNPYLLCVMTKGSDSNMLAAIIQSISARVYKEVDSRKI